LFGFGTPAEPGRDDALRTIAGPAAPGGPARLRHS